MYKYYNVMQMQRKELGLTQADLAEKAGISIPTISAFESGQRIRLEHMEKIAKALGGELEIKFKKH